MGIATMCTMGAGRGRRACPTAAATARPTRLGIGGRLRAHHYPATSPTTPSTTQQPWRQLAPAAPRPGAAAGRRAAAVAAAAAACTQQECPAAVERFDFIVLGSGIAGLSYALKVAQYGRVAVVTKAAADEGCTAYAQVRL